MFEFRLPDVGEGVSEGELLEWHVQPGDEVSEDQVLAEVETDKAVVDLPSPVAGTVEALHAEPGEVVPVGDVVITIDPADPADANAEAPAEPDVADGDGAPTSEGEGEAAVTDETPTGEEESAPAASGDGETATPGGRVFAPPSVRRLARELGVDLGDVPGSGPGGRVTEGDVRRASGGAGDADVADAIAEVAPVEEVGEDEGAATGGGANASITPAAGQEAADRDRTLAAPATRKLADDLGVDIDAVPTEQTRDAEAVVEPDDVTAYADAQRAPQAAETAEPADAGASGDADVSTGATAAGERETREAYRGVRRTIGERMAASASTIPHATHHDRAVVPALLEAREAMKPRAEARGIRLTYVPFVLKAVVAGLQAYPVINASLDEEREEIVTKHYYDLGVATATEAGLMVPVVEAVDEKGLLQLASEVDELTEKARERSISREALQGSTFTVTNFGAIGGEYATPIINHPETAILGLGAIERRPVVADDDVVARPTLPLSLSIDHRVIDGAEAARFVNTVIEYLETPSLLLLE
jgi:pyruvate dehydrogenase E2 component (dihydrolipoamide acetyltransferase)